MNESTKESLLAAIRTRVDEHYGKTELPLLLSTLGQQLRIDNAWPDGYPLNLRSFIERESTLGLHVIRNPSSAARIAVTDEAHRVAVEQSIMSQRPPSRISLGNLPRGLLLAFCTKGEPDQPLYVQKVKPYRLLTTAPDPSKTDQFWEVSSKYRLEDCALTSVAKLTADVRRALQTNVRNWFQEQQVSESAFSPEQSDDDKSSALARLVNAQPVNVRRSMVIPADIALLLSKHE